MPRAGLQFPNPQEHKSKLLAACAVHPKIVQASARESKTVRLPKTSSRKPSRNCRALEGRHLSKDFACSLNQGKNQSGACTFPQSHVPSEQRLKSEMLLRRNMSRFGRAVSGNHVEFSQRTNLRRDQRCCGGNKAIKNDRNPMARGPKHQAGQASNFKSSHPAEQINSVLPTGMQPDGFSHNPTFPFQPVVADPGSPADNLLWG